MKRPAIILLSLLVLVVLLAGCDIFGLNTDALVGTWNLSSMTMLGTTYSGSTLAAMMTVTFTVAKGNTWTSTSTFSGSAPSTDSGTWSKSGSTYTLVPSAGSTSGMPTITGTLSGKSFTVTDTSSGTPATMVFTKN